MTFPKMSTMQR